MSISIDREQLEKICLMGQGNACCRYILGGRDGITCGKHTSLRETIDYKVAAGTFTARGDNCEGLQP